MKVHFIAIGGSAMHNLAIALCQKGYTVTGSDDEIFDPARSHLQKYGILPASTGWHPERITPDLDAVVLGMHARIDNPELLRAQELGLKIYSYPEYLYEQSKEKTRVVIGGSHGKTTITAMILHVLQHVGIDADYMVGAQLEGFEVMVKLSERAKVMVLEGDEYLTSPIDRRPKFHLYKPNIAIISGIAWDHVNVFPTFDIYKDQFAQFINLIEPGGKLIYCHDDASVREVAEGNKRSDIQKLPYDVPEVKVENGVTCLLVKGKEVPLKVFGRHNMLNLTAARFACCQLGVTDEQFYEAIQSFKGASKRLELVKEQGTCAVYKDFAHAPSKLTATIAAMKDQYPDRRLVACMELHTFSSLTDAFLSQYAGSMDRADLPIVYFDPHALELKKLPPLSKEHVHDAFHNKKIEVFNDSHSLVKRLQELFPRGTTEQNLLMMSSGNFDGINFTDLANKLI
jgi:UDP-N-acetylmuramate: L-alanyl-gamma-D-glutamyl-meso-diaminopimelate ligase